MPLTDSGKRLMERLKKEYGDKKGESMFYALVNGGKVPKEKVEGSGHASKKEKA